MAPPSAPAGGDGSFSGDVEQRFADCQANDVTLNGRDHITIVGFYDQSTVPPRSTPRSMVHEGTVTFIRNGIEGRATFNCSITFGATFTDTQASGTATWEYPIGTMIKGTGCGPTG